MAETYQWCTVDFRPAPPGWRVAYLLTSEGEFRIDDLPGWLIQVEVEVKYPAGNMAKVLDQDRFRRVVPGIMMDGQLEAADRGPWPGAVVVLGPNDEPLSEEERERMREEVRRSEAAARKRCQEKRRA